MNDSLPTTSRRGFLKLVGVMGAASAFAGTLSACGTTPASRTTTGASGGASASGSTITAAISYELGTNGFDPMTTTAALTVAANWHTMEGLTEILPSGNRDVYAALGKELPKKVGDTTYEVTLRDGATFHNGSPVTADLSIETLKASAAVESVQAFGLLFAMFNCGSAPFNNVKNRQAFLYALDMEKVVKTAYLGNATPATSFVQNTHPSYKQAKVVYAFDQAKAKALLAETGLKSIRLLCTDHGWVKKATPIIKESLEAAGLAVEFTEKKSSDVYNTIDGKPEAFDAVIAPGDPSVFGSDVDLLMRWWYAGDTWTDKRMHWKGQESHTQVQAKLDEAAKLTGDAQKAKWGELFDLISETVPLYPLFHRKTTTGYDKATLVDFKPISLTGLSFVDTGSTK